MEEEMNDSEVTFKRRGQFPKAAVKGAVNTRQRNLLAASAATLSLLLLVVIRLLIYFVAMNKEMSAENQGLISEKNILQRKTEELRKQKSILENKTDELGRYKDSLNWTMGRILMYENFPVNDFCLKTGCQPCLTGWKEFQGKCYFFYNQTKGWKTWTQSRTYCKDHVSDLVVIETLQEQEFISKNIHYYYDKFHGFWIGLKQEPGQNWTWVNGHEDTLGFWLNKHIGPSGPYALILPGKPLNASWNPSIKEFEHKFICESEVMIKSF